MGRWIVLVSVASGVKEVECGMKTLNDKERKLTRRLGENLVLKIKLNKIRPIEREVTYLQRGRDKWVVVQMKFL